MSKVPPTGSPQGPSPLDLLNTPGGITADLIGASQPGVSSAPAGTVADPSSLTNLGAVGSAIGGLVGFQNGLSNEAITAEEELAAIQTIDKIADKIQAG